MGRWAAGRVFLLSLVVLLALQTPAASAANKPCVIFFQDFPADPSALFATITNKFSILYEFSVIQGLALQIEEGFLTLLETLPGVLKVIPGSLLQLRTTHSWDFLGLAENGTPASAWSSAEFGAYTIIGNIDTGVWPESPSFQDDGLGAAPKDWRGFCDPTFPCNNKLIGARVFSLGLQAELLLSGDQGKLPSKEDLSSPRDYLGHGAHTLSTAGGSFSRGASVFGHGNGTAAGGAPRARVAAYKACFSPGCSDIDILAAILAAVADGVHVLSLSLGADQASDYISDVIAIGTFFAVQSGVTVVCSAGNSGPHPGTATNVAPWMFTVGASTMDRDFPAYVSFGDNPAIKGQSLGASTLPLVQAYPMISGENANASNQLSTNSSLCLAGSLDPAKVTGKIVVCVRGVNGRVEKGLVVKQAGGVGMVLCNDAASGDSVLADPHLVAAAHCSYSQCVHLFNDLVHSAPNPLGYINATDARFGVKPAPAMAGFSSRGPNPITPQILKPDITAPGVNVIAAYSGAVSPTELPFDDRHVSYNIMSGTSMSCPHVSGIVGLLKTKHPSWSPAMIKSAIMTTATTVANDGNPIPDDTGAEATPFSYGSGHVNPVSALDPGLVYDTTLADYTNFLCSLKLTQNPLQDLHGNLPNLPVGLPNLPVNVSVPVDLVLPLFDAAGEPCLCSKSKSPYGRPEDLNYPSIAVPCLSSSGSTTVRRWVKNVGDARSVYRVTVTEPAGVKVTVVPGELEFSETVKEKEFTVTLDVVDAAAASNYVFGSIVWSDAKGLDAYGRPDENSGHRVRSPIVVKTKCG